MPKQVPAPGAALLPSCSPAFMELTTIIIIKGGFFSLSLSLLLAKNVLLQLSTQPPASKWTMLQ